MKKFKVTIGCRSYSTYIVEAENEDEATDLALSGEVDYETHEEYNYEIDGIEEIFTPPGEEITEIKKDVIFDLLQIEDQKTNVMTDQEINEAILDLFEDLLIELKHPITMVPANRESILTRVRSLRQKLKENKQ